MVKMELKEQYKKMVAFFDERAEEFDYKGMTAKDRIKELLSDMVIPGAKVLDIGCGVGTIDDVLIELGAEEVVAIDISQEMIKKAKENNKNPKIIYEIKSFTNCSENDFDFVVVYNSYVHILEREALRETFNNVLKENGRFAIINTANYKAINEEHSEGIELDFSSPISKPSIEKKFYEKYFDIDIIADTEKSYIISGRKKKN